MESMMLSIDDFEEELQGEYGKIFNNIAYIRARKQKYRVHERGNAGKIGKNPCLVTSYKKDEGNAEILSLSTVCDNSSLQCTSERPSEQDMINTNKTNKFTTSKTDQTENRKGLNPLDNESRDCFLYDKVAMDLEAVFNKYMMISSSPDSGESLEGERNTEITLDVANYAECEKPTTGPTPPRNQIKYKTVHTKNDTLYIWTADV